MKSVPVRSRFAAEVARVIREQAAAGDWLGHLPGERQLAAELQVSRTTLREALQLLENEGVLSTAVPGRRRAMAGEAMKKTVTEAPRGQVFLSPFELTGLPTQMLAEVDALRGLLASRGCPLVVKGCPAFSAKRPASALAKLVELFPGHGWILYRASAAVQEWFVRSGLPVVLRGSPHPGIGLPFLDIDWRAVGRHAAATAARWGVGRVLFLTPGSRLEGLRLAEEGFREAWPPGGDFQKASDESQPARVGQALAFWMGGGPGPGLVVCTRARQVVSAQSWLAGQAAPRAAVRFLCLDYDPLLEQMLPPVCHYRLDPVATARRLARSVTSGRGNQRRGTGGWLFPDFHG